MNLDQYWDVKQKQVLYPKDEYHRKHTFDVGETLEFAFVVSFIATMGLLVLGVFL